MSDKPITEPLVCRGLHVKPYPDDSRDWRPIGHVSDGITYGWSRYEDDIEIDPPIEPGAAPSTPARDEPAGGR